MRIIDAHTHFFFKGYFPPRWFQAKAEQWAARRWPPPSIDGKPETIEAGLLDPDATLLLADLDMAGIDSAVCIGLDPWVALGEGVTNDITAHVERQATALTGSPRLSGFVGVDPRRPGAADVVRWAVTERGFRGVKVYAPHGFMPDDPRCHGIYQACVELDVPVMYHTAEATYPLMSQYANPLLIQPVQYAFPQLRIILGHAGYPWWHREAALVCQGHSRTYLEVSKWNDIVRTEPGRVAEVLAYFKNEVGAPRMLFGSDHYGSPHDRGSRRGALCDWVDFVVHTDAFNATEREQFLSLNIARLLGLDREESTDNGVA
jgi:predicted TIM-barrel fold metal-dependent hydrolase